MSQTAFGVLVMGTIFVVMGGTGLWFAWPDLKRAWQGSRKGVKR